MSRRFLILLVAFAAALSGAFADDAPPTGEQVLKRCIERSGGTELLASATGIVMTGTVEMVGHNLSGSVVIDEQGEKSYTAIELPGIGKIEEGFDGGVAWESSAIQGARIKEGDEKAAVERSSSFRILTRWKEFYSSIRNVGTENLDGRPAWKLELTPKQGKIETQYFDKESGFLVRMEQTVSTPLGDIPAGTDFADYRPVEGIQTPFLILQRAAGQTIAIKIEKATYKAAIPPERFDLPDAVKQLLKR